MPGDTFWKGEPIETMHRDVLVEILRQQHFRIEALMTALRQIMEHRAGLYEEQHDIAIAALALGQDK